MEVRRPAKRHEEVASFSLHLQCNMSPPRFALRPSMEHVAVFFLCLPTEVPVNLNLSASAHSTAGTLGPFPARPDPELFTVPHSFFCSREF